MFWTYLIGGAAVEIALLTLVYNLAGRRSDAHNKWLKDQLEAAKANAPDVLIKTLSERTVAMEEELQRLLKDRDYNKAEVKALQAKIDHTRRIQKELQLVVEEYQRRYENLRHKVDVCPYCEAGLVELRDIHDEDWTGSHRKYDCGFTMLDGDTILMCPHDPTYPKFEQLEFKTEYDEERKRWTCRYSDGTMKTWRLPMTVTHGKTEREATYLLQICHEGRLDNEAPTDSES